MSAFVMQVACACDVRGMPTGMDQLESWDNDEFDDGGFIDGRRYVWRCPACEHQVCVNMKLLEEEE